MVRPRARKVAEPRTASSTIEFGQKEVIADHSRADSSSEALAGKEPQRECEARCRRMQLESQPQFQQRWPKAPGQSLRRDRLDRSLSTPKCSGSPRGMHNMCPRGLEMVRPKRLL